MERLVWIIWAGPKCNPHCIYKTEAWTDLTIEGNVTTEARCHTAGFEGTGKGHELKMQL
jgi:hypothetical protein